MKHVRLNNNTEFFRGGAKALFLGNVNDINIVIGANNTRKSRFLRALISQDHQILVEAPDQLNRAYFDSLNIFDELSAKGKDALNEKIIQLQFHDIENPDGRYSHIKAYYDNKSQIDFLDLKTSITNINETLATMALEDHFTALRTIAVRTINVVDLLLWIYNILDTRGLPPDKQRNFSVTNVPEVRYLLNIDPSQDFPHFEIKQAILKKLRDYLALVLQVSAEVADRPMVYIPVLRTSRMIGGFTGDVYGDTILSQHFRSPSSKLIVETGLLLYEKISLARNGTRKQSRDFSAFEKFIGQVFFGSEDLHIVAHHTDKKDERNIKVSIPGELEDVNMQDLGDGIQAIINLLFPVFTAAEGSWIFIDEPENNLHPGYQNLLMQTLANHEFILNKKLRFFINTHSNHILSGALMGKNSAEILVFTRRDEHSSDINSFNGNEYHTLELLGIFNTSVLISNCSIWVEGVTDRFYLQAFLRAYCDTLKPATFKPLEGLHFSFIEYGGKNLIHYEFDHTYQSDAQPVETETGLQLLKGKIDAYFVNTNVFLLADSDFDEAKHAYFENIKRPNFRYCKTSLPEIENILPDAILRSYFIDEVKCKEAEVLACFPIDHKTKLGEHFKGKLTYGKGFRKIASDGGTLAYDYKKGLADFVHRKIMDQTFTWEHLKESKVLKDTVTALYQFITAKNGG